MTQQAVTHDILEKMIPWMQRLERKMLMMPSPLLMPAKRTYGD